jgi:hypothetical protein
MDETFPIDEKTKMKLIKRKTTIIQTKDDIMKRIEPMMDDLLIDLDVGKF